MSKEKSKSIIIEKLTPEQEALIPVYMERFFKMGIDTTPSNRAKAEAALLKIHKLLGHPDPEIVWANSPYEGAIIVAQTLKGSDDVTKEEIRDQYNKAQFGSFECYWVAFYTFVADNFPEFERDPNVDIMLDIIENVGVYWTFDKKIIITEKPSKICLNEEKKLHNADGYAIEYPNGDGVYAYNGTRYKSLLDMRLATMGLDKDESSKP